MSPAVETIAAPLPTLIVAPAATLMRDSFAAAPFEMASEPDAMFSVVFEAMVSEWIVLVWA